MDCCLDDLFLKRVPFNLFFSKEYFVGLGNSYFLAGMLVSNMFLLRTVVQRSRVVV